MPLLGINAQSYPVTIMAELGHYYQFIVCLIGNKCSGDKVGNPHFKLQAFNIFWSEITIMVWPHKSNEQNKDIEKHIDIKC